MPESWYRSLKKDEQSEEIPFIQQIFSPFAKRGIYEIYQSWTAIEQESYSFASPLEAQAQKTYSEME